MTNKPFGNAPRKVKKIDLKTKKVIATYDSISKASASLNKPNTYRNIYACLTGQITSAYGYRWEFK